MEDDRLAGLEDEFAEALSVAIARDAAAQESEGELLRVVLRWHDWAEPGYFTVHLLRAGEAGGASGDEAWTPLEWPNSERELERTDRIAADEAVQRLAAELQPIYEARADALMAAQDAGETVPELPGEGVSRALLETVRRLPDALGRFGVPLASDFAATATSFEAAGGQYALRAFTAPEIVERLASAGELPWE